jgi:chromosome segregation ATPase
MDERYIAAENACTQQNYFIRLCMGRTSCLDRMEARFRKAQADAWKHRARQLEAESQDLRSQADSLQDRIGWYRARYHELKEENMRLHARLARYADLEKKLNERRG